MSSGTRGKAKSGATLAGPLPQRPRTSSAAAAAATAPTGPPLVLPDVNQPATAPARDPQLLAALAGLADQNAGLMAAFGDLKAQVAAGKGAKAPAEASDRSLLAVHGLLDRIKDEPAAGESLKIVRGT